MAFVGPEAQTIEMMGLKHTAREIAVAAGVPVIPGSGLLSDVEGALLSARALGFPVGPTQLLMILWGSHRRTYGRLLTCSQNCYRSWSRLVVVAEA